MAQAHEAVEDGDGGLCKTAALDFVADRFVVCGEDRVVRVAFVGPEGEKVSVHANTQREKRCQ